MELNQTSLLQILPNNKKKAINVTEIMTLTGSTRYCLNRKLAKLVKYDFVKTEMRKLKIENAVRDVRYYWKYE